MTLGDKHRLAREEGEAMTSWLDQAFEELRSLMSAETLDEARRDDLWALLERAALQAPKEYRQRWLPSMRDHPRHFIEPLRTVGDLEELGRAAELAPHARFCLKLRYDAIGDKGARAFAESPLLTHLSSLILEDCMIRSAGARALAGSPYLAHLSSLDLEDNEIEAEGASAIVARFRSSKHK